MCSNIPFLCRRRRDIPSTSYTPSGPYHFLQRSTMYVRFSSVQHIRRRFAFCQQAECPGGGHEVELVAVPQPRERGTAARGAGKHALPVSQAVEPEALVSATGGVLADACENGATVSWRFIWAETKAAAGESIQKPDENAERRQENMAESIHHAKRRTREIIRFSFSLHDVFGGCHLPATQ